MNTSESTSTHNMSSTAGSMAVTQLAMAGDVQDQSTAKGQLPETGQASTGNNTGLVAAAVAMFGGLGLLRKAKKDQKKEQADQ
ncbi:Gram positive anchor [Staphylococcus microti]|uniref:Gram positive anchor n=2 Tax=Staphylococcus microti TaxID=569857 RepID=A0A380GRX3_9STAP|nr:LPXTG cell wall anchor domain-containing protein [Staphylococcus microti]PNZ82148.1 hypothetical protein CD132_04950 [Staphylococcus microti]SUM56524.1 Gram positive anchor [Staphylococcus microti]